MKSSVTASAPGKLMLYGEHGVVYGHPCIVTAVNQRLSVTVRKNGIEIFHLDAPDLGLQAYSKTMDKLGGEGLPKGVRFIEVLYKNFLRDYPQKRGIDVITKSEFPLFYGFGSSSAVTVAFARALIELYDIKLSKKELFDLCYEAVLEVQGVGSGFDVASAIYGGTIYYVSPGKVIEKIGDGDLPLVVGYTGIKADTPTLVRQVAELKRNKPKMVNSIFNEISDIVEEARFVLGEKDYRLAGGLMSKNQKLLAQLGISSVELDSMNIAARSAGAYGAKLSGAGGGDCMVALVSEDSRVEVEKVIGDVGGNVIPVSVGAEGVRVE